MAEEFKGFEEHCRELGPSNGERMARLLELSEHAMNGTTPPLDTRRTVDFQDQEDQDEENQPLSAEQIREILDGMEAHNRELEEQDARVHARVDY